MGNKCDMEDKRVIPTERGQEVAKHHGIPFIETSAKTNINVTRAFHDITLKILEKVCCVLNNFELILFNILNMYVYLFI